MPADNKLLRDIDRHISELERLKEWFNRVYYNPDFSTFFNRPRIATLESGADYLLTNMRRLRADYVGRMGTEEEQGGE